MHISFENTIYTHFQNPCLRHGVNLIEAFYSCGSRLEVQRIDPYGRHFCKELSPNMDSSLQRWTPFVLRIVLFGSCLFQRTRLYALTFGVTTFSLKLFHRLCIDYRFESSELAARSFTQSQDKARSRQASIRSRQASINRVLEQRSHMSRLRFVEGPQVQPQSQTSHMSRLRFVEPVRGVTHKQVGKTRPIAGDALPKPVAPRQLALREKSPTTLIRVEEKAQSFSERNGSSNNMLCLFAGENCFAKMTLQVDRYANLILQVCPHIPGSKKSLVQKGRPHSSSGKFIISLLDLNMDERSAMQRIWAQLQGKGSVTVSEHFFSVLSRLKSKTVKKSSSVLPQLMSRSPEEPGNRELLSIRPFIDPNYVLRSSVDIRGLPILDSLSQTSASREEKRGLPLRHGKFKRQVSRYLPPHPVLPLEVRQYADRTRGIYRVPVLGALFDHGMSFVEHAISSKDQVYKEMKYASWLWSLIQLVDQNRAWQQAVEVYQNEKFPEKTEGMPAYIYLVHIANLLCKAHSLSSSQVLSLEKLSPISILELQRKGLSCRVLTYNFVKALREDLKIGIDQSARPNSSLDWARRLAAKIYEVPMASYMQSLVCMLNSNAIGLLKLEGKQVVDPLDIDLERWPEQLELLAQHINRNNSVLAKNYFAVQTKKLRAKVGIAGDFFLNGGNVPGSISQIKLQGSDGSVRNVLQMRHSVPVLEESLRSFPAIIEEYKAMLMGAGDARSRVLYCDHLCALKSDEAPRISAIASALKEASFAWRMGQTLDAWVNFPERACFPGEKSAIIQTCEEFFAQVRRYFLCGDQELIKEIKNLWEDLDKHAKLLQANRIPEELSASSTRSQAWFRRYEAFSNSLIKKINELRALLGLSELSLSPASLKKIPSEMDQKDYPKSRECAENFAAHKEFIDSLLPTKKWLEDLSKMQMSVPLDRKEYLLHEHWGDIVLLVNSLIDQAGLSLDAESSPEKKEDVLRKRRTAVLLTYSFMNLVTIFELKIDHFNTTCKDGIDRGAAMLLIMQYLCALLSEEKKYKDPDHLRTLSTVFFAPAYMAKSQVVLPERLEAALDAVRVLHALSLNPEKLQAFKDLWLRSFGFQVQDLQFLDAQKRIALDISPKDTLGDEEEYKRRIEHWQAHSGWVFDLGAGKNTCAVHMESRADIEETFALYQDARLQEKSRKELETIKAEIIQREISFSEKQTVLDWVQETFGNVQEREARAIGITRIEDEYERYIVAKAYSFTIPFGEDELLLRVWSLKAYTYDDEEGSWEYQQELLSYDLGPCISCSLSFRLPESLQNHFLTL